MRANGFWTLGLAGVIAASGARASGDSPERRPPVTAEHTPSDPARPPISETARLRAEAQLDACVAKLEKAARRQGDSVVVLRMARELGVSPETLLSEQAALGCYLGDLLIAHALRVNVRAPVTASQLIRLHDEGTPWTDIALGFGLRLRHVVRGLINETRVAAGLSRGDGRIASMRLDRGARWPIAPESSARSGETASSATPVAARGAQQR